MHPPALHNHALCAASPARQLDHRVIAAFLVKKVRQTQAQAQCGAITLVQRFGSASNLNVHFHMLIPDGVFLTTDPPYFRAVAAPTAPELQALVQRISERVGRQLERKGWLPGQYPHS